MTRAIKSSALLPFDPRLVSPVESERVPGLGLELRSTLYLREGFQLAEESKERIDMQLLFLPDLIPSDL